MRITIAKVRNWIVVLGVVLVLAIAGFFAYARYRVRQVARDLPARLGLEIQQSTNDFTISKSHAGRTLFVLHASKAVQYKGGGRAVLHDVSITLYSRDGKPADHISGSQFDYDPATKIARADGAVDIELADPTALKPGGGSKAVPPNSKADAHAPIHVKTSGLVFNQETQVASTEQTLLFEQGEASGSARGATYDSDKGTLVLMHDVILHAKIDDDPIAVTADGATYDRNARQLYLIQEKADYSDRHGSSDQAIVFFRPDGAADHITTQGHVHFTGDDGSDVQGASGRAQLDASGALEQVRIEGGLLFISRDPVRSMHVNSNSGTFNFTPGRSGSKAIPKHVQLTGAASVVEQQASLPGDPHGSETREFRAGKMDVDLSADDAGHVRPAGVLATGSAIVIVHTIHEKTPQQETRLKGDQIFAAIATGNELSSLRATGDTSIEQSTPGGIDQISSADSLFVKFLPGKRPAAPRTAQNSTAPKSVGPAKAAGHAPGFGEQGSQIDTAMQQGHVLLVQTQPGTTPGAPPVKTNASADRIAYTGASGTIELSGGTPSISQEDFNLTAATVEFNRVSGSATASGSVKASYSNTERNASNAAMHVLADHAALDHAKDETTFYGAPHADARLWQGGDSITAPVLVLSRTRQLLSATGPAQSVKATFVENGKPAKSGGASAAASGSKAGTAQTSVIRTTSSSLIYSGGEHKATLTGGVVAQEIAGTLRASTMELYLHPEAAAASKSKSGAMGPSGQLDRLVAEGHVQLTQGDRTGTGEKLVYTADDGHYVLTGTSNAEPRVTDPQHGSVSGSSLIFNNRDDSVVVSHGQSPTMTDTHTNRDVHTPHPAKPGR